MISICAWCRFAKLKTWFVVYVRRREVTHGMCPACLVKFDAEWAADVAKDAA